MDRLHPGLTKLQSRMGPGSGVGSEGSPGQEGFSRVAGSSHGPQSLLIPEDSGTTSLRGSWQESQSGSLLRLRSTSQGLLENL